MPQLLVTLDTNQLNRTRMEELAAVLPPGSHVAVTTVNEREQPDKSWKDIFDDAGELVLDVVVPESAVWGESTWGGGAVWAGTSDSQVYEDVMRIIGAPPPGQRENPSKGQRNQVRDAMIFTAHVRDGRHLLITNDLKAFVKHGRREALEALGATRILTPDEVLAMSPDDLQAITDGD